MEKSCLNQDIVLELNAHWNKVKWRTVADAITCLCSASGGKPNALVVPLGPDGIDRPIPFEDWMQLPVRHGDPVVWIKSGAIRAPLAIICPQHDKIHWRTPALSNKSIYERDGGIDQYDGDVVPKSEGNVDHIIPRDVWKRRGLKGSPDRWENMVWTKKKRNFDKGNKMNYKAGLKLIKKPKAPKQVPVAFSITKPKHDWQKPLFE